MRARAMRCAVTCVTVVPKNEFARAESITRVMRMFIIDTPCRYSDRLNDNNGCAYQYLHTFR